MELILEFVKNRFPSLNTTFQYNMHVGFLHKYVLLIITACVDASFVLNNRQSQLSEGDL